MERVQLDLDVSRYHTRSVRTTIGLDDDVYAAAQHLSHVSGERLGKVISKLARQGLERKRPRGRQQAQRFPTFDVPAGAAIISASHSDRILHEEGSSQAPDS